MTRAIFRQKLAGVSPSIALNYAPYDKLQMVDRGSIRLNIVDMWSKIIASVYIITMVVKVVG